MINAVAHRSIALEIGGRLHESEQLNRQYLQRAAEPFWQGVPLAGYARFGLGRVLYERNDLHAAREHLTAAYVELEAWSLKRPIIVSCVLLARVHQALGEPEGAHEWMGRAVAMVHKDELKQTFSHWAAEQARIQMAQGDLAAATRWAREIEPTTGKLDPALEFEHITLAHMFLAQQRLDDAQHLLARLRPRAEAAGRWGRALAILVLQALTAQARGEPEAALTTLDRVLALAEPEGYVRSIVDAGAAMAELLAQRVAHSASSDPHTAYAAQLLAAFPEQRAASAARGEPRVLATDTTPTPALLVEPLTERERQILQLGRRGLLQSGDRGRARGRGQHGQEAYQQPVRQARGPEPYPSPRARTRAGVAVRRHTSSGPRPQPGAWQRGQVTAACTRSIVPAERTCSAVRAAQDLSLPHHGERGATRSRPATDS